MLSPNKVHNLLFLLQYTNCFDNASSSLYIQTTATRIMERELSSEQQQQLKIILNPATLKTGGTDDVIHHLQQPSSKFQDFENFISQRVSKKLYCGDLVSQDQEVMVGCETFIRLSRDVEGKSNDNKKDELHDVP